MPKRTDPTNPRQEIPRCLRLAFRYAEEGDIEKSLEYWRRAEQMGYVATGWTLRQYRRLVGELPAPPDVDTGL
jgi:hypothetical protein